MFTPYNTFHTEGDHTGELSSRPISSQDTAEYFL